MLCPERREGRRARGSNGQSPTKTTVKRAANPRDTPLNPPLNSTRPSVAAPLHNHAGATGQTLFLHPTRCTDRYYHRACGDQRNAREGVGQNSGRIARFRELLGMPLALVGRFRGRLALILRRPGRFAIRILPARGRLAAGVRVRCLAAGVRVRRVATVTGIGVGNGVSATAFGA